MVAEGTGTTLGMEYFCSRGDDLWTMPDADLIALAKKEISKLGLAEKSDLGAEGHVIRELNAYPVYDAEYRPHVDTLRAYFHGFSNLQTVGRSGMHRYNNQDHSILAGHHAALRLLGRPELDPLGSQYRAQRLGVASPHPRQKARGEGKPCAIRKFGISPWRACSLTQSIFLRVWSSKIRCSF
jgi:hypothetical protein